MPIYNTIHIIIYYIIILFPELSEHYSTIIMKKLHYFTHKVNSVLYRMFP